MHNLLNKYKLLINIGSNFAGIIVNVIISFFLAPYLIRKLGVVQYGVLALINTFPSYIQLFTNGLSNAATKFMTIALGEKSYQKANSYFNTTFVVLLRFLCIMLPLVLILAYYTPLIFEIPKSITSQSQLLVLFVLLGTFFTIIASPLRSVIEINNKFLTKNIIVITSKILAVFILLMIFEYFDAYLSVVGVYQVCITLFTFLFYLIFYKKDQTTFRLRGEKYEPKSYKKMKGLTFWNTIDDIAVILFLMVNQTLINWCLGPGEGGYFAPIMLLISLLIFGSNAINNVMIPLIYKDIAKKKSSELLEDRLFLIAKIMTFAIGFMIIIISVFAQEFLSVWLGEDFKKTEWIVVIFMNSYLFGNIVFLSYYNYFRGVDKMKITSIVNLCCGIFNVLLIVFFLRNKLGLLGVAIAFALTYGVRGLVFYTIYMAKLSKRSLSFFIKRHGKILILYFFVLLTCYGFKYSISNMFIVVVLFCLFYGTVIWKCAFAMDERVFIKKNILKL